MILKQRLSIFASMMMLLGGCTSQSNTSPAAPSSTMPGATGRTVVPGNMSTVGSDRSATSDTKTGQTSTGASGGGGGGGGGR